MHAPREIIERHERAFRYVKRAKEESGRAEEADFVERDCVRGGQEKGDICIHMYKTQSVQRVRLLWMERALSRVISLP